MPKKRWACKTVPQTLGDPDLKPNASKSGCAIDLHAIVPESKLFQVQAKRLFGIFVATKSQSRRQHNGKHQLSRLKSACQLYGVENIDLSFNMGFNQGCKTVLPNFWRMHVNFNWPWIFDALGWGKCLHVQNCSNHFEPISTIMNIKSWTVYLEESDWKSFPFLTLHKKTQLDLMLTVSKLFEWSSTFNPLRCA